MASSKKVKATDSETPAAPATPAAPRKSSLEAKFDSLYATHGDGIPPYSTQVRFHSVRRWRFDVAWEDQKVALELQGGVWSGGRHARGKGIEGDIEKINAGITLGWVVLAFTTTMLDRDPAGCFATIRTVLDAQKKV